MIGISIGMSIAQSSNGGGNTGPALNSWAYFATGAEGEEIWTNMETGGSAETTWADLES